MTPGNSNYLDSEAELSLPAVSELAEQIFRKVIANVLGAGAPLEDEPTQHYRISGADTLTAGDQTYWARVKSIASVYGNDEALIVTVLQGINRLSETLEQQGQAHLESDYTLAQDFPENYDDLLAAIEE